MNASELEPYPPGLPTQNHSVKHRKIAAVLAAPAAIVLVLLSALAWHGHVTGFDRTLTADIVRRPGSLSFRFSDVFSVVGSGPIVALFSLAISVEIWRRSGDLFRALVVPIAGAIGGVAELAGKQIVGRLRPLTAIVTGESGFGFPSGHTTGFTAMAFATAWVVTVAPGLNRQRRRGPRVAAGVLAMMVALSRVLVGAHYVFDVLAGLSLGVLCALASALVVGALTPFARSLVGRHFPTILRRISP